MDITDKTTFAIKKRTEFVPACKLFKKINTIENVQNH